MARLIFHDMRKKRFVGAINIFLASKGSLQPGKYAPAELT